VNTGGSSLIYPRLATGPGMDWPKAYAAKQQLCSFARAAFRKVLEFGNNGRSPYPRTADLDSVAATPFTTCSVRAW